ncbi:MAG: hypothetical protein QOF40_1463 [Actinomycetota bacterium]|jgi:hypothetical protein|nr:hypothetical protein [Actinomycetota bacterium]
MKCPKCGAENPDEEWNCGSCRINLYWATQHYEGLAEIREGLGLPERAPSPSFLIKTHHDVMADRAARGGPTENKVRATARKVMRRKQQESDTAGT